MSRVSNRVGVDALRDLLDKARVAVLAHVDASGALQALPVAFRWREGRFRIGLSGRTLESGARVAIAVDDGSFWWELRAVLARGALRPSERSDASAEPDLTWFDLEADRVTAWDYSALREEL